MTADPIEPPYLSACIMCRDEERVLERCLASLVGVVDEIVFVDTGSTDSSIEIAKRFGAVISHFTWCDDFAAARNQTLRRARGRWILSIDCDEHLEGELAVPGLLKAELRALEANHGDRWPVLLVKIPLIDKDIEERESFGLSKQFRIFPNDERVFYTSPIHNRLTIDPSLNADEGCTLELTSSDLRFIHRGYDPTITKSKKKSDRAFRILKKALETQADALNYFYLGREYVHIEAWADAVAALRCSRDMLVSTPNLLDKHHLQSVYHYLTLAMNKAGLELEVIRDELVAALTAFPESPDLWNEAGCIFMDHNELEGAKNAFDQAEALLPLAEKNETSFLIHRAWTLHLNKSRVLSTLGDVDGAKESIKRAVASGLPDPELVSDILEAQTVKGFVRAGLASIPERKEQLALVIQSILPQVDALTVYLNGYEAVPIFLAHPKITIVRSQEHGDLRDTGKFWALGEPFDYYFSIDDDIWYPANYVSAMVAKIEAYGRMAVVGVHGADLRRPVTSYIRDRDVVHAVAALADDRAVEFLGTGTTAFHKSTLSLGLSDFPVHGMTDIWFSKAAARQGVPRIAIARRERWLIMLDVGANTLFEEASRDDRAQTVAVQDIDCLASPALQDSPG